MQKLKTYISIIAYVIRRWWFKLRLGKTAPAFRHENMPYFSQWETPELNDKIIRKEMHTNDDPNWRDSGAQTLQEYEDWSWSACGMACTKMMLAHRLNKTIPIVELGKLCATHGGYQFPLVDHPGLYYRPYVRFLQNEYGLVAKIVPRLSVEEIIHHLSNERYVMVSVSPDVRQPDLQPKTRGGHLVLVTGYDHGRQALYLHNPSGYGNSQAHAEITYQDFQKFFAGKGIVIT